MPSADLLIPFFLASAVFACVPGPGMFYAAAQTLASGRKAGWWSALGFHIAGFGHVAAAAFGVSALLAVVPALFTVMKLVGYPETIHVLADRLGEDSSVVLFGGRAKDRPYPGSTTVTTINGGVSTMIVTLALELAPVRFNAIHPGIVGDSPFWAGKPLDHVLARTPTKRLVTMADVVDATVFLLENRAVNGVNLYVDAGWMLM